ncbi:MAG: hypothetical protein H6Q11_926 [Acidobacteria bacterium]|nr:hypothetical protein [Acidobacteriota bacterium]
MGKVVFTGGLDHPLHDGYSTARGPALRSEKMEVAQVHFEKGKGAHYHHHPEEQLFYILEGRLEVTVGEGDSAQTYVCDPGEASFHPSNVPHKVQALENVVCMSFKCLADPAESPRAGRNVYTETGRLDG